MRKLLDTRNAYLLITVCAVSAELRGAQEDCQAPFTPFLGAQGTKQSTAGDSAPTGFCICIFICASGALYRRMIYGVDCWNTRNANLFITVCDAHGA